MKEGFCTFLHLATRGKGQRGPRYLSNAFPKDEKDKTCTGDTEEDAGKKELKFSSINYTISAISIGFALSGFPRKTANNAEMRSG